MLAIKISPLQCEFCVIFTVINSTLIVCIVILHSVLLFHRSSSKHVCLCVRVYYINTHAHTLTYTHSNTHTYTHIHMHTHRHTHSHTHTQTHTHTHTYTCTHTHIHTLKQTHIHNVGRYINTYI